MSLHCWICRQQETDGLVSLSHRDSTQQKSVHVLIETVVGIKLKNDYKIQRHICSQCLEKFNQTCSLWKQYESFQIKQGSSREPEGDYICCKCAKQDVEELIALACVCDSWNLTVSDMIEFLSGVVVEPDASLSPYICDVCLQELNMGCTFKQQCLEAELSLHNQAVRDWDMMKFENADSDDLIVDLYAAAFPRWNTRTHCITHIYCMICSLETPIHLFSRKCNGCCLEFKNFDEIVNKANESQEITELEIDSNVTMAEHVDGNDFKSDFLIKIEPNSISEQDCAALIIDNVYNKPHPDIDNCFDILEDLSEIYQKVRRKGPMCCGCKIFFLSKDELRQHRKMHHVQMVPGTELCYICKICTRIFRTRGTLRHHEAISERDTYFYCKICKQLFDDDVCLNTHKATIHGNENANSMEILNKFRSKTVMRYRCKINGCKKVEKYVDKIVHHYSIAHKLQLDEYEVAKDPTFRVNMNLNICKIGKCGFKSRSLPYTVKHCSTPHTNKLIPRERMGTNKSRFEPDAPDLKQFTIVDNIDNNLSVLTTDSEFCCGCFTFHRTAEDFQLHFSAVHDDNKGNSDFAFKCTRCNRRFKGISAYTQHMSAASKGVYYYCNPCKEFLWDLRDIKRHKITCPHQDTADDELKFETIQRMTLNCCGCNEQFDTEEAIMEHRKNMHPPPALYGRRKSMLICELCNKQVPTAKDLTNHQARAANKNVYRCKIGECVFETRSLKQIKKHVFGQAHLDASGISVCIYNPNPIEYECCVGTCTFTSRSYDDIVGHVIDSHNNAKSFNAIQYQGRNLFCEACNKGYDNWHKLLNHKNKKPSCCCKYCGKNIKKSELETHLEECPMRVTVDCDVCCKQFESPRLLRVHKKNIHKPNPVPKKLTAGKICSVCGLVFTNIVAHMLSHTDQRPFKCSQCPMSFRSNLALSNHSGVHATVKAYACRHGCGNRYSHATDRFRHERAVHLNIKPHTCSICSKSFVRDRDLRLHSRIHTGRKLYPCDKCDESFDKLSELREHRCNEEHLI
ncbi:zinc finger protein 62 homolog isoform X2 [Wyeomyia smithii]|uniref:zinc finger protein 62 homolog isoform X2 n=1 Tax=Wyeomyia smithii TaxID=174621 RepID=UPI002467D8E9|nr:zinc finger protein 62 homolog isoform X2 [Wyeomyia smithii]